MHITSKQCTVLRSTAKHCTAIRSTAQHFTALYNTAQHCTALQNPEKHCTSLQSTALHNTAHHCTTLHSTGQHCTALHRTCGSSPGGAHKGGRRRCGKWGFLQLLTPDWAWWHQVLWQQTCLFKQGGWRGGGGKGVRGGYTPEGVY